MADDIEIVARMIDPVAWELRDKEPSIPKHKNPGAMDWERYRELGCAPSIVKATTIHAHYAARLAEAEAGKARLREAQDDRADLERLACELTDQGKLIEAGWVRLRLAALPDDLPKPQLQRMQMAFFAGAQCMISSIMTVLDDDRAPTEADLRRIGLMAGELHGFVAILERDTGGISHDR